MCLAAVVNTPDRVLAQGEHKGFQWVVTFNNLGARCGYIRVPHGHPWYMRHHEELDVRISLEINFSDPDKACGEGVDDGWWFGFDCSHARHRPDPELCRRLGLPLYPGDMVGRLWTQPQVEAQCRRFCDLAAKALAERKETL